MNRVQQIEPLGTIRPWFLAIPLLWIVALNCHAADLEVGRDANGNLKPFATIREAVEAADPSSDDRIVLYGGAPNRLFVYNEVVVLDKEVDIVAGPGPAPRIRIDDSLAGLGNTVLDVRLPADAEVKVSGLQMIYATTIGIPVFQAIAQSGHESAHLTLENMQFNTGFNPFMNNETAVVFCDRGKMTLNNCNFSVSGAQAVSAILLVTGGNATANDCTITGFARSTLTILGTGSLDLNRCVVRAERHNSKLTQVGLFLGGGRFNANESIFSSPDSALGFSVGFPHGDTAFLNLHRCFLDSLGIFASSNSVVNVTNTCVIMDELNTPHFLSVWDSPTIRVEHSTITSLNHNPENTLIKNISGPGANLELHNNVLSLPGSNIGAVSPTGNTIIAGRNLVFVDGGTGNENDVISGEVITTNPMIHDRCALRVGSPAIDAGTNSEVRVDREGCQRPARCTPPDLGADEYHPEGCNFHKDTGGANGADITNICPDFRRGDTDLSGSVDFTDALRHLAFLFLGQGTILCEDAADSNDDGLSDFTDPIFTLTFLFLGGDLAFPGPENCGQDLTEDNLDCLTYPPSCE